MNRTVLAVIIASLISAVAGSALTWVVAYPRSVASVKASQVVDEEAEVAAVAAKAAEQLRADQRVRDHDAIARVAESLRAVVLPLRPGMTIGQHRAVLLRNAASIAAVDTSDCPGSFQETYRRAAEAISVYAGEFNQAPISAQALLSDMVSISTSGGIAIPVLLHQAASAHAELSAQAAAQMRATATLERLGHAAARYEVTL